MDVYSVTAGARGVEMGGRPAHQSEALLCLCQGRVRPQADALVKVGHRLLHLVQQDLELRGGDTLDIRIISPFLSQAGR